MCNGHCVMERAAESLCILTPRRHHQYSWQGVVTPQAAHCCMAAAPNRQLAAGEGRGGEAKAWERRTGEVGDGEVMGDDRQCAAKLLS